MRLSDDTVLTARQIEHLRKRNAALEEENWTIVQDTILVNFATHIPVHIYSVKDGEIKNNDYFMILLKFTS